MGEDLAVAAVVVVHVAQVRVAQVVRRRDVRRVGVRPGREGLNPAAAQRRGVDKRGEAGELADSVADRRVDGGPAAQRALRAPPASAPRACAA
eukprot:5263058-Prymnesium_polylepis.1